MDKKKKLYKVFNEYFDHIYVITLKRSKDRHKHFKKTLNGLDYTIFWAVDGKEIDLDDLVNKGLYHPYHTKLLRKRNGMKPNDITKAHLGCSLSHANVYRDVIKHSYSRVLIFEDDLIFSPEGVDTTIEALKELPFDWELLRFGHFGNNSDPDLLLKIQVWCLLKVAPLFQKFERLKMLNPDTIRRWFARPYSEHLDRSGYHFGNHAYAVTQQGADKILKFQTPVVQRADNAISELCAYGWLNAFNVKKRVFFQNKKMKSAIAGQP